MASETYYFLFSILLVEGAVLFLVNLLYLRTRGKSTFGFSYKPGTPEHKRSIELASNRNIAITTIIALIFIANLVYDINRLIHFSNQEYARAMLTYGSTGMVIFSILIFTIVRKQAKDLWSDKQD